jgi:nucleotidyltransferase substrate binding protein (TIGR01987 family)
MKAKQNTNHWEQHFSGFKKALEKLTIAINIFKPNEEDNLELEEVDDLLKDGMFRRFEYTHELSLNVIRDYAAYKRNTAIKGPKDVTREGLKLGLIEDAEEWMAMLKTRDEILFLDNEKSAEDVFEKILEHYYLLFLKFGEKMEGLL